ncbi:phosphoribosyltransferase family protein [Glutamicibacter protophormiae]|uniref:phosphoribosyltransferase n=1 Tax=Glutamicibacter protophormiae TaxID=37930 RepID=UPI002A81245F|nr:phosphoribosyltransferase family protein [Glutamicibacter protophormiae]WPR66028.1 phosphoribosyltransferase family protein [Glutamicibacter protophormiae]WPR69525.1 phosphoribosyltransferase family protein [Glutamicibacter protophormiae]
MADQSHQGYRDRSHAGAALGIALASELPAGDYTVLGLLRGGVPIAAEVARSLDATLGALPVRKLGVPSNPEIAFGAIASYGTASGRYLNPEIHRRALRYFGESELETLETAATRELMSLAEQFKPFVPPLQGRHVILCDDGIATGATMMAALDLVWRLKPGMVVVAAPVAPSELVQNLAYPADRVVIAWQPPDFRAVGGCYRNFAPVQLEEVLRLLRAAGN